MPKENVKFVFEFKNMQNLLWQIWDFFNFLSIIQI